MVANAIALNGLHNSVKFGGVALDLSGVGIAQAHPGVAHLLIMHHRIVDLDVETEPLHRQCTNRREQGVRGDNAIVLRGDERNARVHQFLLGVEHVERRPLSDPRFLAHAVERDFG